MITEEFVKQQGMNAELYLNKVDQKYKERWQKKLDKVKFTEQQQEFLSRKLPTINIVVISADWCGDCQNGVPILIKIAEKNHAIKLHIIDRDSNIEMLENYLTAGAKKVPMTLFMDKEFNEITRWVERSTLAYEIRYRAKAEAIQNNSNEYTDILRALLKENSNKMFEENQKEIIKALQKTTAVILATMKLEDLKQYV